MFVREGRRLGCKFIFNQHPRTRSARERGRETAIGCLPDASRLGTKPATRPLPCPGPEPATFRCPGSRSASWAAPAGTRCTFHSIAHLIPKPVHNPRENFHDIFVSVTYRRGKLSISTTPPFNLTRGARCTLLCPKIKIKKSIIWHDVVSLAAMTSHLRRGAVTPRVTPASLPPTAQGVPHPAGGWGPEALRAAINL